VQPVDIDHFDAEALERRITSLRYVAGMSSGKTSGSLKPLKPMFPEFRGEEHPVAFAFDRAPDQLFVGARPVGIRGDDQVDSEIDGAMNGRDRLGSFGSP